MAAAATAEVASANGGSSIANAPQAPVGTDVTGGSPTPSTTSRPPDEFWLVALQKGDQLAIDYGEIYPNARGVALSLYTPDVTDYTLNQVKPVQFDETGSNDKEEVRYTATQAGNWIIDVAVAGQWCCDDSYGYEMTVRVKYKNPVSAGKSVASDCADYYVLDSRGSGEPINNQSPPGGAFVGALQARHSASLVRVFTNPYPAVSLPEAAAALLGPGVRYQNSVALGAKWVETKLAALRAGCPKAKFYLTGYSQGADAAAAAYQSGLINYVSGVVLFGDPRFNSADTWADRGSFVQSKQHTDGLLGPRSVFANSGKVLSFCNKDDPICQRSATNSIFHRKQHNLYADGVDAVSAAKYFSNYD